MIQEPLMKILREELPELEWTVDYRAGRGDTGTVYSTGGSGRLSGLDMPYRYPTYQVYIRARDWDFSQTAAEIVFRTLHKKRDFYVNVDFYKNGQVIRTEKVFVFLVTAMSEPIRVGVEDDLFMVYSINFDVILSRAREETTNG